MAKIWVAKYRPCSRVPHDPPDAIPAFAAAFPSAILAPMLTQEINTTQPGCIAQDGNDASKAMTASFGVSRDPACGSGGMFVQSGKFVESRGDKPRLDSENALNSLSTKCPR